MVLPRLNSDTIVAIATPLGEGGLGVIRLSGPQSIDFADLLLDTHKKIKTASSHTAHHGWIKFQGQTIDEVVAVLFRSPASYTGEDVVELSCHGSPAVLKKIVSLCEGLGARPARPGEFTERAYLNGKIDLLQAEAVAELIHAKSEKARASAAEQLKGSLTERFQLIRTPLVDLLAHVEANLDFVEEELPLISRDKIIQYIGQTTKQIESLLSMNLTHRWLREGVRVVLAGRPNAGKSSLFNALLSHDRAIVTDIPGTTRDTLEESLEWDGFPLTLIDTAGLRESNNPVENLGTQRARSAQQTADIIVLVWDGSVAMTPEDQDWLNQWSNKPVIVALNKSDLGIRANFTLTGKNTITLSARTGHGLEQLKKEILKQFQPASSEGESQFLTNARHVSHLNECQKRLKQALESAEKGKSMELIALDLRGALDELGAVTGENTSEDVLDSIFQHFCIGK